MVSAAAIYARISRDSAGDLLGVTRQADACRERAERVGWPVAEVYVDDDVSAHDRRAVRHAYRRLLDDLAAGRRDAVLVWDLDRLHRQPRELEEFMSLADSRGVALASVSGEVDLGTASGRLHARMLGAVAAHESEHKSERLRAQRLQAAQQGRHMGGGRRPYGYQRDGVTLDVGEVERIRWAAATLLAGDSVVSVARRMNAQGWPSAAGGEWTATKLRSVLAGPRLAGLRVHRGQVVGDAEWPAVLERSTYDRLRLLLGDPRRRQRGRPPVQLLTGLAVCGLCGATLHSSLIAGTGRRRYVCNSGPGKPGCGRVAVLAEPLDGHVTGDALGLLVERAAGISAGLAAGRDGPDVEARALAERVREDRFRLDQLARDHYAARLIGRAEFLAAREALDGRVRESEAALARLASASVLARLPDGEGELRAVWAAGSVDWRRAVLGAWLDGRRVVVGPARRGLRRFDPGRVSYR